MVCIGTLNSLSKPSPPKQTKAQRKELVERHKFNRSSSALKPPETGAAAHMSLHQYNNEKEQPPNRQLSFPPVARVEGLATDLAVNRASLFGEAPLTRGYLCGAARPVNGVLQFYVVAASFSRKMEEDQHVTTCICVTKRRPSAAFWPNRASNRRRLMPIQLAI
jgi:hypothetical protein